MAKFDILKGKQLAKAIAGRGKAVETFTAREHQLAYSALMHVEEHHCASHLNALLNVTPTNYRAGLIAWSKAFGKVTFDAKEGQFVYSKTAKSDMEAALEVAPANYQRAAKANDKPQKSLMEATEKRMEKTIADEKASTEDKAFARAMLNSIQLYKRSKTQAKAKPTAKSAPKLVKKAA